MIKRVDAGARPINAAIAFLDGSVCLGMDVVVWHYARILSMAILRDGVSIGGGTEIGVASEIGENSRISANCFLPAHSKIGKNVFIGPGCVFTDDRYPKCGNASYTAEPPIVEDEASVGAGCVILPGVKIGFGALVGAGSVVDKDVPPHTVLRGDGARRTRVRNVETSP